jgi:hypothetical protein
VLVRVLRKGEASVNGKPHFGAADAFRRLVGDESEDVSRLLNVSARQVNRYCAEHDHQNGPLDYVDIVVEHILRKTGDVARAKSPGLYLLGRVDALTAIKDPCELLMALGKSSGAQARLVEATIEGFKDGKFTREEFNAVIEAAQESIVRMQELIHAATAARFQTKERRSS